MDGYGHYTVSPGESGPLSGIDMGELAERISKEIDSGGESKKEGENKEAEMIRYHFIKEREGKVARESIAHYLAKRFLWHEHERTNVKRMPGPGSENAGPARQTNKA